MERFCRNGGCTGRWKRAEGSALNSSSTVTAEDIASTSLTETTTTTAAAPAQEDVANSLTDLPSLSSSSIRREEPAEDLDTTSEAAREDPVDTVPSTTPTLQTSGANGIMSSPTPMSTPSTSTPSPTAASRSPEPPPPEPSTSSTFTSTSTSSRSTSTSKSTVKEPPPAPEPTTFTTSILRTSTSKVVQTNTRTRVVVITEDVPAETSTSGSVTVTYTPPPRTLTEYETETVISTSLVYDTGMVAIPTEKLPDSFYSSRTLSPIPTGSAQEASSQDPVGKPTLSKGAKIGIGVGCGALFLLLLGGAIYWRVVWRPRRKLESTVHIVDVPGTWGAEKNVRGSEQYGGSTVVGSSEGRPETGTTRVSSGAWSPVAETADGRRIMSPRFSR